MTLNILIFIFFMCDASVSEGHVCTCVCCRGQKRRLDPVKLGVSCELSDMGAGDPA